MEKKIRRIFIAEPSLRNWEGHFAQYNLAVKASLEKLGYETTILANGNLEFKENEIDLNSIIPIFPFTDWRIKTAQIKVNLKYKLLLLPFLLAASLFYIPKKIYSFFTAKKIFNFISDNRFIYFSQKTMNIFFNFLIKLFYPIMPIYRNLLVIPINAISFIPKKIIEIIKINFQCFKPPHWLSWLISLDFLPNYYSLIQFLKEKNFNNGDLLFAHMITRNSLHMWALVADRFATNKEKGELVLLFREPPERFALNSLRTNISLRLLENAFQKGGLRGSTDSSRLAKDYAKILAIPLDIFPIPHIPVISSTINGQLIEQSVTRCIILGNTRPDKNITTTCQAIEQINSNKNSLNKFFFSFQINEMSDKATITSVTHLKEIAFPNVSFYEGSLSSEQYQQLLIDADVVLVPYCNKAYSSRTSGIVIEAIAAGKIVVGTQNCWLADECIRFDAAAELVPNRDVQAIVDALFKISGQISSLKSQAKTAAIKIRNYHNGDVFAKRLLYGPPKQSINTGDLITISYPFSNFISEKSGSSTRIYYLMKLLDGYQFSILAPTQILSLLHTEIPSFNLYSYTENNKCIFVLFFFVLSKVFKLLGDTKDPFFLVLFNKNIWNRSFYLSLTQSLNDSKAILVEYPFQTKQISIYAKAMGIPLIATAHDQHSLIAKNRLRRNYIDKREIESLSCADLSFTVSQSEHEYFLSKGIINLLAPSTTDVHSFNFSNDSKNRANELIINHIGRELNTFFLFVGGNHGPNREATTYLRQIAKQADEMNLNWDFVVAGRCADSKDSIDNYIALGQVDDTMLKSLYETCCMVVSPLLSGTGASVKTIEAMGAGKVIFGTEATFRGLSVTNGIECFIENNILNYIDRLENILFSPNSQIILQNISENAKHFAEKYDYHICLREYKLFLENWNK